MNRVIYTIGHSNQLIETFVAALEICGITAVADVRSYPHSQVNPQFDREMLRRKLKSRKIAYVFLGKELGGRTDDPSCYVNERVQYGRLAETNLFQQGLDRIERGMRRHRIAVMCAEKEPLECHRAILIARQLVQRQICVRHILRDRQIEDHEATMSRLLRLLNFNTNEHHLFRNQDDLLREAYRIQGNKIGYEREKGRRAAKRPSGIQAER